MQSNSSETGTTGNRKTVLVTILIDIGAGIDLLYGTFGKTLLSRLRM